MQRQWARLARRGWCAGVVPTAPRSLERVAGDVGSGASLDSAPRANIGHCGVRGDNADQAVRAAIRTPKDYVRAFLGAKHVIGQTSGELTFLSLVNFGL